MAGVVVIYLSRLGQRPRCTHCSGTCADSRCDPRKGTTWHGGRGQTLITTVGELDKLLESFPPNEISAYGLVLETNSRSRTTGRKERRRITKGDQFTAARILSAR